MIDATQQDRDGDIAPTHLDEHVDEGRWRIERTSLITLVMERIDAISSANGLVPGTRLPSERELRDTLGVGRSTVREALRAMEALGIVEMRQGKGAYLLPRASGSEGGVRRGSGTALADLEKVVEARLAIETFAAALAATRRTKSDLQAMELQLDRFREAAKSEDLSALVIADVEFHAAIMTVANPVLAFALDSLGTLVINSRRISLSNRDRHWGVLHRHEAIYEAIALGSPKLASNAMADHLSEFVKGLGMKVQSIGAGAGAFKYVSVPAEDGAPDPSADAPKRARRAPSARTRTP